MWSLLETGVFHHVSSDHAPSTRKQKLSGSIWDVHFGLPGLDTTAPLLIDAALRGRISLGTLARVYAEAPARRYGLHPRKGVIAAGSDADFLLINPAGTTTIDDASVISKAGWTPYAGRQVRGRHVATFLRGQQIAAEGHPAGHFTGTFVPGPGWHQSPACCADSSLRAG